MVVRRVTPPSVTLGAGGTRPLHHDEVHALRSRWRTASLATGWPFPSDWALNEVDDVCRAMVTRSDVGPSLDRLGKARAEAGAGLAETLQDLAALHAVLEGSNGADGIVAADPDAVPTKLIRVTALGWADVVSRQVATTEIRDGLTGLATAAYLRARLHEAYREAWAHGEQPSQRYALVLIGLDLSRSEGWSRLVAMVLVADALRVVFDGGETAARLSPSVAVVLTRRDARLPINVARARGLIANRLAIDPDLACTGPVKVWLEKLPITHESACELLSHLAR